MSILQSRCPFPAYVAGFASAAALYAFVRYWQSQRKPYGTIPESLLNSDYREEVELAVELAYAGNTSFN